MIPVAAASAVSVPAKNHTEDGSFLRQFPTDMTKEGGVVVTRANFEAMKRMRSFDELLSRAEEKLPPFDIDKFKEQNAIRNEYTDHEQSVTDDSDEDDVEDVSALHGPLGEGEIGVRRKKKKSVFSVVKKAGIEPKVNSIAGDNDQKIVGEGADSSAHLQSSGTESCSSSAAAASGSTGDEKHGKFYRVHPDQFVVDSQLRVKQQLVDDYSEKHQQYRNRPKVCPSKDTAVAEFAELSRAQTRAFTGTCELRVFGNRSGTRVAARFRATNAASYLESMRKITEFIDLEAGHLHGIAHAAFLGQYESLPGRLLPDLGVEIRSFGGDLCCGIKRIWPMESVLVMAGINSETEVLEWGPDKAINVYEYNSNALPGRKDILTADVVLQSFLRQTLETQLQNVFKSVWCGLKSASSRDGENFLDVMAGPSTGLLDLQWDIPCEAIFAFAHGLLLLVQSREKKYVRNFYPQLPDPDRKLRGRGSHREKDLYRCGGGFIVSNLLTVGLLHLWLLDDATVRSFVRPIDLLPEDDQLHRQGEGEVDATGPTSIVTGECSNFTSATDNQDQFSSSSNHVHVTTLRRADGAMMRTGDMFALGSVLPAFGWRCLPNGPGGRVMLLRLTEEEVALRSLAPAAVSSEAGKGKDEKLKTPMSHETTLRIYACVSMSNTVMHKASASDGVAAASWLDRSLAGYVILPDRAITASWGRSRTPPKYKGRDVASPGEEQRMLNGNRVRFEWNSLAMFIEPGECGLSGAELVELWDKQMRSAARQRLTVEAPWRNAIPDNRHLDPSRTVLPPSKLSIFRGSREETEFSKLVGRRCELAANKVDWFRLTYPEIFFNTSDSVWYMLRMQLKGCRYTLEDLVLGKEIVWRRLADAFDEKEARRVEESENKATAKGAEQANFIPAETFDGSRLGYVFKRGELGLGYYRDAVGFSTATNSNDAAGPRLISDTLPKNPWRWKAVNQHSQVPVHDPPQEFHIAADQDDESPAQSRVVREVSRLWRFFPSEEIPNVSSDLRTFDNLYDYADQVERALNENDAMASTGSEAGESDFEVHPTDEEPDQGPENSGKPDVEKKRVKKLFFTFGIAEEEINDDGDEVPSDDEDSESDDDENPFDDEDPLFP
ncbi:unnamed protein product [Amoebophrya sp. A120]|nr:unnamed protein product [Amoebophrya sp. A120]|eukprot:GSA120T00009405001.1